MSLLEESTSQSEPSKNQHLIATDPEWQPNTFLLFALMEKSLNGREDPDLEYYSEGLKKDALSILNAIGFNDSSKFETAWRLCDLDWFHSEFMRLEGYHNTIIAVKQQNYDALRGKGGYLNLARKLGQIARLDPASPIFLGDRPFDTDALSVVLATLMPKVDSRVSVFDLCYVVASNFRVTPYRLERTFTSLSKKKTYMFPYDTKALGPRQPGYQEAVVDLGHLGFSFIPISSAKLKFGSSYIYSSELVRAF